MDLDKGVTWLFLNIFQILKLIRMTQFLSANKKITGKTATFLNVSIVSLTCETPTCDKRDAAPCCAKAFCKWKRQKLRLSSLIISKYYGVRLWKSIQQKSTWTPASATCCCVYCCWARLGWVLLILYTVGVAIPGWLITGAATPTWACARPATARPADTTGTKHNCTKKSNNIQSM